MKKIRPQVQMICHSIMSSPLDWTQTFHTFKHKPTGLEIWTSNGDSNIGIYSSRQDVVVSKFNNWNKAEKRAVKEAMESHQDFIVGHYFASKEGEK